MQYRNKKLVILCDFVIFINLKWKTNIQNKTFYTIQIFYNFYKFYN